MPDASSGSVNVELDGTHLRVDARPARLVSLLRGAGGDPVLTAQRSGGDTHTEAVPAEARQVTFQVQDELSVEANRTSDFVALAEESGRRVVVAFNGEVTVLPSGSGGDRFALGAHEALLMPAGGGEPKVVPVDDLSDDDQDQISAVMEAAAMAVVAPTDSAATDEGEPTQAMPAVTPEPEAPAKPAASVSKAASTPAAAATTAKATSTPAKAGNAQKRSGKKGKKGRPQPQKRSAPLVPAATGAAAGAAAASGVTKKSVPATPAKKSAQATAKKAAPAKAGGGGGGGHNDDSYEDTPADRRFIAGAVILALLVVIVLGVFVLTGDNDKKSTVAADSSTTTTTTTSADQTTSTSSKASTTSVPATTSTVAAAVTTVAPTTAPTTTSTTAATTTTAAAAAVKYAIEPKSCVQNANNSITYTATLTNQSTATFDYTIGVGFKDADGASVAKSDAKVDKLAAGKSADFTATGTPPRNLANTGTCTVERVDARPSGA